MDLLNYFHFLEPIQDHVTRIYSTTSEILTVVVIIWCLNFIAGMIQRTYSTGQAFGRFYGRYLHKSIVALTVKTTSFLRKKTRIPSSENSHNKTDASARAIY